MLNRYTYGMILYFFMYGFLVCMLDKKFFHTPEGLKQILAYELYVNHGLYQKDIADFLGCSNNTVANYVKKLKKYTHLKDFKIILESKTQDIQEALGVIKNTK